MVCPDVSAVDILDLVREGAAAMRLVATCLQVLAFALFVCSCQVGAVVGWVDFVAFTAIIQAAAFFTGHILNRFPDMMKAVLIVSFGDDSFNVAHTPLLPALRISG